MGEASIQELATSKLKEAAVKASGQQNVIITYLLKRVGEDAGFAEDVNKKEKTFALCFKYITDQARKQAKNGCAMVKDDVVYEWAEDYYRKEEKEPEKKESKKPLPIDPIPKEKAEEGTKENPVKVTTEPVSPPKEVKVDVKVSEKKEKPKKKAKDDMEGQMSLFDFMGGLT